MQTYVAILRYDCDLPVVPVATIEDVNNYISGKRSKDSKQPNWLDIIKN